MPEIEFAPRAATIDEMTTSIRLLSFDDADGATNMARDEAMLESAESGCASLRFYTWSEPTVSLGYFQPSAGRTDSMLGSLAWVRRSTGGAAIVHHHELTYSFALPAGPMWKSAQSWICRFHHLLADVLARAGIESHAVECGEEQKLGDVLCFLHQTAGDLLIAGSKVAGSAQRKLRGTILQHGSILLRASEHAPGLRGINDFVGRELFEPAGLAGQLAGAFAQSTGSAIRPGDWSEAERARVPVIRDEKYGCSGWNEKR